jgi:dipeptidyl aminopeptidase/acylaminoacyl peptidase
MTQAQLYVRTTLAAALMAAFAVHAAPPAAMRDYRALAMTANGERIAAIESMDPGGFSTRPHGSIVVRDARSGKVLGEYDPCATCNYDQPSWSPDQKSLAFIASDAKAGKATLYVLTGTAPKAVANVKGIASSARWSPDGLQLSVLATIEAKKLAGAVEAGAPQVGEIGSQDDAQRIALVPAAGGELRLVSPADTYVYEYDWTPDGKGFAVTSAKGNGDNNWWIATLGHIDAASGALRIIAAPKMQMNIPRVSPDGKTVAFIGGLMSDFGSIGGDVFTVPLAGGEALNVTPGYAGSFNGLAWQGKNLLASALVGSDSAAVAIDPAAKSSRILWTGPVSASAGRQGRFVFSADGSHAASVHESFEHASHIAAGKLPAMAAITHDNDGFTSQVSARSISWTNEGFKVQGWLVGPKQNEAGKTHPMIVQVHGGPSGAATARFVGDGEQGNVLMRDMVKRGYYIFLPNPRGSFGQGEAFTMANKRDFGGGDWRDILAGVDAALKVAPIDEKRLGLMGHSYGGFMTMWGVTHSNRFKAAVAGAGIANWISYYGQNGIDQWMVPFFGATMYDDPAIYRAASPLETIKNAKTPTLIMVGERDVEVPAAQSVEFWHGLRAMNVPVSLVIFEGEGHAFRKPESNRERNARTLAWFEKYLK